MKENFKATLKVNKKSIETNPFVEEFLARTVVGGVSSLRGAKEIHSLEIHQDKGEVKITVNGNDIPLNPFTNEIIGNTLVGLASSLKGVDNIQSLDISVEVQ